MVAAGFFPDCQLIGLLGQEIMTQDPPGLKEECIAVIGDGHSLESYGENYGYSFNSALGSYSDSSDADNKAESSLNMGNLNSMITAIQWAIVVLDESDRDWIPLPLVDQRLASHFEDGGFSWYPVMQNDPHYPHYPDPSAWISPPPDFEESNSSCPNDCWILNSPSKEESPP